MSGEGRGRRQLLRQGAGGLTLLAALGGCTGSGGQSGSSGGYARWIPAPASMNAGSHYEYLLFGVDVLRSNRSAFDPSIYNGLKVNFANVSRQGGVPFETVGNYLSIGSEGLTTGIVKVLPGSFDTDSVKSTLSQRGYSAPRTTNGYAVYDGGQSLPAVAIGSDGLILAGAEGTRSDVVTVVETRAGSGERYTATEDFRSLVDALGTGLLVSGGTNERYEEAKVRPTEPQFVGQVAAGASFSVDGATTNVTFAFVFEDEGDVETETINEWLRLDRTGRLEAPFTPGQVEGSGRVVTATGTTKTAKLFV